MAGGVTSVMSASRGAPLGTWLGPAASRYAHALVHVARNVTPARMFSVVSLRSPAVDSGANHRAICSGVAALSSSTRGNCTLRIRLDTRTATCSAGCHAHGSRGMSSSCFAIAARVDVAGAGCRYVHVRDHDLTSTTRAAKTGARSVCRPAVAHSPTP